MKCFSLVKQNKQPRSTGMQNFTISYMVHVPQHRGPHNHIMRNLTHFKNPMTGPMAR